MATNRDLLKEAIADAKAVKETAITNAKLALEEAFTPHLKSMLSAKLAEMDKIRIGDDYYLSIDDYAKYVGKVRKTVYNWIDNDKVKTKKLLNRTFVKL